MKIGILTHPLHNNYGGILQAYALQTILRHMGNDVEIISREYPLKEIFLKDRVLHFLRVLKNKILHRKSKILTGAEKKLISTLTEDFINTHIKRSPNIYSTEKLKSYCRNQSFDAIVVGSDQVWRPKYSPCIEDFYLEFAHEWEIIKVAYAASFGVDNDEYTKIEKDKCGKSLKEFKSISVREISGISLCENLFGITPILVLDPTLLLDQRAYLSIIESEKEHMPSKRELFCYLLDKDDYKNEIVKACKDTLKITPYECMPKRNLYRGEIRKHIEECKYPSPSQWIKSIIDAEMVITDSFHGAVFSIIFNKPFWVIENQARGNARLRDLLELFGLKNRLLNNKNIKSLNWRQPINWQTVNKTKEEMQDKSLTFLRKALTL